MAENEGYQIALERIQNLGDQTELTLFGLDLDTIPPEIVELVNLESLNLGNNQLTNVPGEIGELVNLKSLDLSNNQLTSVPGEIGELGNLKSLDLMDNQLDRLTPEFVLLANLQTLDLDGNEFRSVPKEIWDLVNLKYLYLNDNGLENVPPEIGKLNNLEVLLLGGNQLEGVPQEFGELVNLRALILSDNPMMNLPEEIVRLVNLENLFIRNNHLESLPLEIGELVNLQGLELSNNEFTSLPSEIGELVNLQSLDLSRNKLKSLPSEIVGLVKLESLKLSNNELTSLPSEIVGLVKLTELDLSSNGLEGVPPEIGELPILEILLINGNPITWPPISILEQGDTAVIKYLQAQWANSQPQWRAKLLVVGQGGVGKTQLLRRLRGLDFDEEIETTHGIEIQKLTLPHPDQDDVEMELNAWDFGGQEIYHATHQFFYSNRSLFLLAWNARHEFEQGKIYYWLDRIQALAPDSPVILVATHMDERDAELPIKELKQEYPQIVDWVAVSNKEGTGFDELSELVQSVSAELPLMGQKWPEPWLHAAEEIADLKKNHITPQALGKIMEKHEVTGQNAKILANYLHDLGELLYFQDQEGLDDIVILRPEWVAQYISDVLENDEVIERDGVFTKEVMRELWKDLPSGMQDHFLRLMEQFDLSYRTLADREISLVVERLPLDHPDGFDKAWNDLGEQEGINEISMIYELDTIPPGIPTWFIARSHRFTTGVHWRKGAVFANKNNDLSMVRAFPNERRLQLSTRGVTPQDFFALLKDGIELTIARFPGMKPKRIIPCPGHDGEACTHEFDYEDVYRRIELDPPVLEIECNKTIKKVSVTELLFGLDARLQDQLMGRIDELEETLKGENLELRRLLQREFLNVYRREQSVADTNCPNVFTLRPLNRTRWQKLLHGETIEMQLYCQAPGEWHPTEKGGLYTIDHPEAWLAKLGPYVENMVKMLQYVMPIMGPWVGMVDEEYSNLIKNDLKLMGEMVKLIPDMIESTSSKNVRKMGIEDEEEGRIDQNFEMYSGSPLRILRHVLDNVDPVNEWGGLNQVTTPEGHVLWLCDHHKEDYRV